MSSIQTLHELLWNLSDAIWSQIEGFDLETFRKNIPDFWLNNYFLIHYAVMTSKYDIGEIIEPIATIDQYAQSLTVLEEKYGFSNKSARANLLEFLVGMTLRLFTNNDSKYISKQIAIFLDELEGNPVRFKIHLLLYRVFTKSKEIKIDLNDILALEPYGDSDILSYYLNGTIDGVTTEDVERSVANIINTLRLLSHAGIEVIEGDIVPDSFLQKRLSPDTILSDSPFMLEITKRGAKELRKYFKEYYPKIIKARTDSNYSHIDIALQRYTDALVRRGPLEQRITYAITSLEALLLKPKEREGLSRRLGQRVAIFLGLLGIAPSDLYGTVLDAYDARSTFIHGGKVEDDIDVETICQKILVIVRNCLLSFLQIIEEKKDKIINLLDKAIIDDKVKEKLGEIMKNVIIVSIPS